jgi:hypothetical protein
MPLITKNINKINIMYAASFRRGHPPHPRIPCAGECEPLIYGAGGLWPAAWESREINGLRASRACDRIPAGAR